MSETSECLQAVEAVYLAAQVLRGHKPPNPEACWCIAAKQMLRSRVSRAAPAAERQFPDNVVAWWLRCRISADLAVSKMTTQKSAHSANMSFATSM